MLIWSAGSGVLTYLAALKDVPQELYESAAIDGANGWRRFYRITLPMLTPVIFFNLINGFIAAFQIFTQPSLLAATGGATLVNTPIRPIYTYVVQIMQEVFLNRRFGYGLSMVWVLFAVSIVVTRLTFWSSKFWVYYETDTVDSGKKKIKKKEALNYKDSEKGVAMNNG